MAADPCARHFGPTTFVDPALHGVGRKRRLLRGVAFEEVRHGQSCQLAVQLRRQLVQATREHGDAAGHGLAMTLEDAGQLIEAVGARPFRVQEPDHLAEIDVECLPRPRRQHEKPCGLATRRSDRAVGVALQDGERRHAAEPVRVHADAWRALARACRQGVGRGTRAKVLRIDGGVQCIEAADARHAAMLERERGLHHGRDAACCLEVPQHGLRRPEDAGASAVARRCRQHGFEGVDLARVAQAHAGSMRFDAVQRVRWQRGVGQRLFHRLLMSRRARRRDAERLAGVPHARAPEHAVDVVAIGKCLPQWLEHQRADTFAADESVRTGVERQRAPLLAEQPAFAQHAEPRRRDVQLHASDDGLVDRAFPKRIDGSAKCDQHARAGRVHGFAHPAQVEEMREAVGGDIARRSTGGELVQVPVAPNHLLVVDLPDRQQYRRAAACEFLPVVAAALDHPPDALQEQALLRIHQHRFACRDVEQAVVEALDIVEEHAAAILAPVSPRQVRWQRIPTLARVRPGLGRGAREQRPEVIQGVGVGQADVHADDGDVR